MYRVRLHSWQTVSGPNNSTHVFSRNLNVRTNINFNPFILVGCKLLKTFTLFKSLNISCGFISFTLNKEISGLTRKFLDFFHYTLNCEILFNT